MIKLHLGCGRNILDGWINTDYNTAKFGGSEYLDVTKKFPYNNNSVDYIFSEHMIEHITYHEGKFMLEESFRVLKVGGKIRISTPDLKFLIKLYNEDKTELQKRYIEYSFKEYKLDCNSDTFVINNFHRDWGHIFIYDEKTLKSLFELIGFFDLKCYGLMESDDEELRGLEHIIRQPDGFIQLESFTVEGTKK